MDEAQLMAVQKLAEIPCMKKRQALLRQRLDGGDTGAAEELDFVNRKLAFAQQISRAALISPSDAASS